MLYLVMMTSKHFSKDEILDRVTRFRLLISSTEWGVDPRKAFLGSEFAQGFHGNVDLLVKLVDSNASRRAGFDEAE
jgi:hypothetical protein